MSKKEIKKEQLSCLMFPIQDVLADESEKKLRKEKLEQAMKLGNCNKMKVKVIFTDLEGLNFVYTTIWFVSDMHELYVIL